MKKRKHPRRIKLIKPRLQFRLIGAFVGLTALTLLLQFLLLAARLTVTASSMDQGGEVLMNLTGGLLIDILLFSFGVLLPLVCAVGVLVTFRIAGPVYRFEQYLGQVARGEDPGPCRIRKGDQLQDLCDKVNEAVSALRGRSAADPERSGEEEVESRPAA